MLAARRGVWRYTLRAQEMERAEREGEAFWYWLRVRMAAAAILRGA